MTSLDWTPCVFTLVVNSAVAAQTSQSSPPPAVPCECNCSTPDSTNDTIPRENNEADFVPKLGATLWDLRANAGFGLGSHSLGANAGLSWETWSSSHWGWGLTFLAAADMSIFDGGGSIIGIGPKLSLRTAEMGPHGYFSLGAVVGSSQSQTPTSTCNLFDGTQPCMVSNSSFGGAAELAIAFIVPVGPVQFGPVARAIGATNVAIATVGLELGFGARK